MYKFSVFTFSEKEIEQITTLTKRWAIGDIYFPVDARKLSKQVKAYARNWALLEEREGRLYLTSGTRFDPRYSLPIEVLWRLVQPMLRTDGATGYSIVNNILWEKHFGIWVQNSKYASERELQEKEGILCELASYQYIILQMAGSTWSITIRERVAA